MASGKIAYLAHGQRGKKIKNKGSYQRSLHIILQLQETFTNLS